MYLVQVRLFHFEQQKDEMTSSFFGEKMAAGKDDHMTKWLFIRFKTVHVIYACLGARMSQWK